MPHHLGKARHKAIPKIINTPCLQLCGICPDAELGTSAYNISIQNPHREAVTQDQLYNGSEQADYEVIKGVKHYKIYTDGSCVNGTNRIISRAGWGVFYAKGDTHNCAYPLDGPVQSSFRSELKALLHVVRTTAVRP